MSSRAFSLTPGQPVPDELRRVARGRIDHALDELRGASGSSREEAVHEARKDMKKLRALLRLVRSELGDDVYRSENETFRDTARHLAGARDADVMLATLGDLEERFGELPGVAARLRPALVAHRFRVSAGSLSSGSTAAVATLVQARARIEDWPLESDSFDAFEQGLRRSYRRGRRGFETVREIPSAENVHEWRKRVKDLWYHLSLLEASWPAVMGGLADEAHALSDRLGDDHDLVVLRDWAHEHGSALNGADPLLRGFDVLAEARRRELQVEAYAYAARLYADKPGAFVRRVRTWWETAEARRPQTTLT
jgi:CHAD domain-containing protein